MLEPQTPGIPVDDPRVLALARARQLVAHRGLLHPVWEELTDKERELGLLDARNYLQAAVEAGLLPSSPEVVAVPREEALLSWSWAQEALAEFPLGVLPEEPRLSEVRAVIDSLGRRLGARPTERSG